MVLRTQDLLFHVLHVPQIKFWRKIQLLEFESILQTKFSGIGRFKSNSNSWNFIFVSHRAITILMPSPSICGKESIIKEKLSTAEYWWLCTVYKIQIYLKQYNGNRLHICQHQVLHLEIILKFIDATHEYCCWIVVRFSYVSFLLCFWCEICSNK